MEAMETSSPCCLRTAAHALLPVAALLDPRPPASPASLDSLESLAIISLTLRSHARVDSPSLSSPCPDAGPLHTCAPVAIPVTSFSEPLGPGPDISVKSDTVRSSGTPDRRSWESPSG